MTEVGGAGEPRGVAHAGRTPLRPAPAKSSHRARARVEAMLDEGTFAELDRLAATPAGAVDEAAVTGTGAIDGRDVAVYALDSSRLDEVAARKVVKVQELALRSRIPIIALLEPTGPPIEGDVAALAGHADVLRWTVRASGVVPRLAAIVGPCADEALWSPALADVALAVAGRAAVPTGLAHLVADDEAGCWRMVRALLSYLPSHSGETPPFRPTADPADRADAELQTLAPDPFEVAVRVLDEGRFLEIQPSAARDVLVGFGRLAGHAVGVLANRPGPGPEPEPEDVEAATKAARFVRLCDRFNVPLVSLVDSPGGSVAGGAGLIQACAEATVPRLTVITRRARGGAYVLAASRQMGADLCLAWPSAEIAAADAYGAAERGYVDAVIEPRDTRRLLVRGLELCLRRP